MQHARLALQRGTAGLAVMVAFALPVAARPAGQAATPATAPTTAPSSDAYATMMGNMQTMQEQMTRLRSTTDPTQRANLLAEHMKMMQSTLQLMAANRYGCPMGTAMQGRGVQGGGMPVGGMMGSGTMRGRGGAGGPGMMQMMMNQMMEHQQALDAAGH